ncbi:microtubule-actin cross-linking factor 1-like isoform X3 [Dysidea avara]|uniref:microtubule-actin cross-linking factor 1-like isoform X3 n=1 Tax=Dysidea avara TaxID=196820 RepID=UPI0033260E8F
MATKDFEKDISQQTVIYAAVQKKTFTKWVNSHLSKVGLKVIDLYVDFKDGTKLLSLLEVLTEEKFKREKGKMRIHHVQNVKRALDFLEKKRKIKLVNIGPEEIVDGEQKLILGLMWTLILHFQMSAVSTNQGGIKESLLRWVQNAVEGYDGVEVTNFTNSWRNGMAFCAVIDRHRSDLFDFDSCDPSQPIDNMNKAFQVAEDNFGIIKLLDPEDVAKHPEEKSIMTYVSYLYHQFPNTPPRRRKKQGPAVSLADYSVIYTEIKRWLESKIKWFKDQKYPNNARDLEALLAEVEKFRSQELAENEAKKQGLTETETKLLAQKVEIPHILTMGELNKLWATMVQEMANAENAMKEELARLQKLEDIAVKLCRDCGELPPRISALADQYKELVNTHHNKDIEVITSEHQAIKDEVEAINTTIADITERCKELEKEKYYNLSTVQSRIKSTTEQHRIVTDSTGILGRCVTELMWCVRQQDIECSRVYSHSELSPDELSRRGKEFQVEMTQHDVPLLVREAKQCVSQKYPFANIIEVVSVVLENSWMVTVQCYNALKCHVEQYTLYCQVIGSVEKCETELVIITKDMDKYWNDPSSTQWVKLDVLKSCNTKVKEWGVKMEAAKQQAQNMYPYELRTGPLPKEKSTVIAVCDCPQLQLEAGKEYQLLDDITGKKKWKAGDHLVCSTLLHITPPSLELTQRLDGICTQCEELCSTITVRLEQAEDFDQADRHLASLTELISWLQPLASQLDQQSPVGDTLEDVQTQCDWLKDCDENVRQKEDEIGRVLNVQLKLQSGPRLEQVNNKKKEFTVLWEGFREKKSQWSITLENALRSFTSTAAAEASVKKQELWVLKKGKPPKNQRVLQYIEDVKLFIEEDISRCASDVDKMVEEYKQYQQSSQGNDELKRRVDVVNEHWKWLKKTVDKYASKNVAISEQTKKFDNEYQGHITWSSVMVEYINELPKLSVEMEQLDHHKDELEMKSKEADGKEYEVDDIKTCSNFFELCLQPVEDEYKQYREKLATCSSPVTVLESEIEQAVPPVGYSHDPSEQEGSIVEQADAVEKQWKWIVEVLKQRLDQCNDLMKKLKSFEEKYQNNLTFIEQGEELIKKYHSLDDDSSSIKDPVMFAMQREKCQEFRQKKFEEQQRHTAMLEEGRKINGLNYIDVDNDLSDKLNDIIDRWHDLNQSFDMWYQDVMDAEDNFKQWDTMMTEFTDKFVACHQDNPLPTELDPSKLKSQVVEKQEEFMKKVWTPLEELTPLLDQLEANKEMLSNREAADKTFTKYHMYYNKAQQQKSQLEEIKLRAEDYEKPYESVSKWITETDRVLVKSKPLSAVPQLVKEQLDVIKAIEEEMTQHSGPKDKLVEDTGYIALLEDTVKPIKLVETKKDFEDTWQAIEDQVAQRKVKAGGAADKLSYCWSVMEPLLEWLKEAEQKAKRMSAMAKNKSRLETQLQELQVFIDDVDKHSSDVKATEDSKDQFVEMAKEYESVLEQYSLSPAELESGFTRIASITFAHNTKRATSSASELGRNVLSQDVEKMRQRYDKLLATLKRKLAKLQEINDKHSEVIKAANVAEGTLSSIQDRKDDLTKQTNWSQPAVIQSHVIIAEDLRKECRALEQAEVATLKRAFHDLEKARQDIPGDYTDITSEVADEDDAEQTKSSIIDRLYALVESLLTTKSTLEKAHNKLTTMNQALSNFMTWLEDTERKLRSVVPDEVTLKAFEEVTERCNVIDQDVNDHKSRYADVTGMINDYLTEFGSNPDIEEKSDNLIRRWNQLLEDLAKKKEDYGQEVEGLKTLEGNMIQYDSWLKEEDVKVTSLPPLAWSVEVLKQQQENTQALLDEMVTKYDEDYDKGIHPHATHLITPYQELNCDYINTRTSEEASKYEELVEQLTDRLTDIETRSRAIGSLLADQEDSMTSLNKIDEQVEALPENSLLSTDVDHMIQQLEDLKGQFAVDKDKVDQVVKQCDQITTSTQSSLTPAGDEVIKSTLLTTSPGRMESSVDFMETSVDAPPPKPTSAQEEGLKELRDTIKLLEEKCSAVEDKLKKKEVVLADRKAAVEKYGNDFDKFHKELDHLVEQLNTTQPVLTDDDVVKGQIDKTEKLVEEIQQMEPDLQLLSDNASLLLEGTGPDEETTKSFEANLADEKKRYQDTLESARTMCDMLKSESGKVQEVYGVLISLKSWLTEQQHKLDTMRPAAVLTTPLTDQITETDQLSEEVKAKEESFEQLQNTVAQLGDNSADHPIHKNVREAIQHYHDIDNVIKLRTKMLSEFKRRVAEYEREVETFTQWLTDCCKRGDQLPVPDMSTDGVQSQLDSVEELQEEVRDKEPQCGTIRQQCDQLCNDPTDSVGNNVDPSLVTVDYHPSADTVRDQLTQLDQTVEQLKKKLRDRENELKEQQEKVKKLEEVSSDVSQWLDEKEGQLKDCDLTEVEPTKIQEKMTLVKLIEEEQTTKKSSLDSLDPLLVDVVSGSSTDNPLKQQLEEKNEDVKKRWQQLANTLEDKQEALTEALRLAEKYKEDKSKVEQWMKEANTKLDELGPPPSNPQEAEKELNKIKVMKDEYEEMWPTHTTCCDTANTLATNTTDPTVTEALNTSTQQQQQEWQQLGDRLTEADNKLGSALGRAHDLDRRVTEVSDWLNETLVRFNSLDPCAARVYLIDDQISEAKATLEEITSKGDSIQVIQNIGQEVMSQCSPQDKDDIQQKLKEITTNFADVEDMAKLHLEDLNEERVKAEDYEKQGADLDDWLKGKEAIVEQWEEFAIDSATLEQQMEKIGTFEEEVNKGYPVVSNLNESEKKLLASDLETIRQYEIAFPNGPPEAAITSSGGAAAVAAAKKKDGKEVKGRESSGFKRKPSKREKDRGKLESSVDKSQLPDFAKRGGAQEAVDEGRKLRKRYEDLKRNTDNRLIEVQDLLRKVQDYETALGSFGDWLREEKGTVNLIESFACTTEGINAELAKIKDAKHDFKMKKKELEQLCSTGTALIAACKVEDSKTEAERKLSETNTRWGDLLKALDDKKESLLAKQKEVDHYNNLLKQFSGWMDGVEKKLDEPVDLVGDPHKIADKLEQMKELAQEISDHKSELDTVVHAGKVTEYPGPAEDADSQPNRPQSGYSAAIKRYEDAQLACQEHIQQLEETLNKISEVRDDINQLIVSLNDCQSKIKDAGQFRVKPDDAKEQLESAQELNAELEELQPVIEEKETTGQLFAVSPVAALGVEEIKKEHSKSPSPSEATEDSVGTKSPTPTPAPLEEANLHPTVPTGKSLKELLEQLAELNSTVKELSTVKLKMLEDRLEKARKFEEDYHDVSEWFRTQQEELSNVGSVRGVPEGIKEQLALHQEFQDMIEGKKPEIVKLKSLAEELKEGVPDIDENYLNEQLADLDSTVAILAKSCAKHQQELEDGLQRSNNFYAKLEEAMANVKQKKEELAKISPAGLDIPSVKSKLDELNVFQKSLDGVSSQVSEVMMLGQQLKDSCSDKDDDELDQQLKELATLWSQLNSDLQQRIQYLQGILLRLGQFHDDLRQLLTWMDKLNNNLKSAPAPGVEPPAIENNITQLQTMTEELTSHQPELVTLFKDVDDLIAKTSDPSDTTSDKLRQYKEDTEKRWAGLDEAMTERRGQLDKALEKAKEFQVVFQQETLWLNSADDRLNADWSPHGLVEKCKEEIDQHKEFVVEVKNHDEPIKALKPLGEGLKPQGSKEEQKMVDTWLKGLQRDYGGLDNTVTEKGDQLEAALEEAEQFETCYTSISEWVDAARRTQEEADPIRSELDAVQNQLETHKATLKEVSAKEKELSVVVTQGQSLSDKCVEEDSEVILQWLDQLHNKWDHLNTLLTQRKTQLEEALLTLGQFQQAFDELWVWLSTIHAQLQDPDPVTGKIDEVTSLLTKHSALQKQLGAKQSTHKAVGKAGKQLLSQKTGEDGESLKKKLEDLEQKWSDVCMLSADWQQKLEKTRVELKQFNVLWGPLQKWLAKVAPRLSVSEPVYGNRDTVERLIESHQQLQKEMGAQHKKVESTKTSGEALVNELLDDPEPVKSNLVQLSSRWDDTCKASETRQNRLDQALLEAKLFEASYDDALEWVQMQSGHLASQPPPQEDVVALQKQIDEQKAFSAELLAKQPEIDKVLEKGEQLLEEAHPDAVPVLQNMIQALQDEWKELKKMTSDRSEELATALLELQGVEEMLVQLWEWVEGARKKLAAKQAEPIGDTLEVVEAQLAEHESFQEDMATQQPNMEALQKVARRRRGGSGNQDMPRKINDLHKKWQRLWLGATDRHRVLTEARQRLKDIAKARSFNYENWRQRFVDFASQQKLRLNNLFIKFDANHDRKLNREEFINALKSSGLPMTRIELEKVADVFFPDRRALHLVDVSDIVAQLTRKHDWKKVENESDAVKIEKEIQHEVAKCTCPSRFKVEQIGEGKYKFGDSQRPYLVRILRTTVMVRVGGGWITLMEFLQKHDPCRASSRTNVEIYKEIRSKKMTPGLDTMDFQSKVETKKKAKNEAVLRAATADPDAEVKTKILPSGRKATEISKRTVVEKGDHKSVVDGTDHDVPKVRKQTKSSTVDPAAPRQKHALPKRLDREKLLSPPRAVPSAAGHLPSTQQDHTKGTSSPSMIPRAQVGQGISPRKSPSLSQDRKRIPHSKR